MNDFYVYIMASQRKGTLYVGSTANLIKRVWEHKNNVIPSFTSKYNIHKLVYYETYDTYAGAAQREKRLKNWHRQWKIDLIEGLNPLWRDLYQEICS
ncbi:GIY-YIG nuclease family protein [Legionella impletisoli]|uniref:Nuclease n=1 Tax=Legionella impletisoli TaxID=343510 RepID=A0A917N7K1_9GAMM|nr:GIY-YIG nuclease family protein [Legionella impletisoli]GGI75220.1 nuclease [Legionella impletisoli]